MSEKFKPTLGFEPSATGWDHTDNHQATCAFVWRGGGHCGTIRGGESLFVASSVGGEAVLVGPGGIDAPSQFNEEEGA